MNIFISWRSGFFKEIGFQKIVESGSILQNHFEETLKKIIHNQNYGANLKKIIVIFYIDLYYEWPPEYNYRGDEGGADVIIDARKWLDSSNVGRMKLYADGVKLAAHEFYKIMQTYKSKREFDVEKFTSDVDAAYDKACRESTKWYNVKTDRCSTYDEVNAMKTN